ncbi:hypothetical protein LY28_03043 [Ruminiclostridium sufflavum DSM 19573]|uniref:Phosphatidylglycerol lysyltransferase C-terminal domain-containing protein n=1 Tax=Ruminiclostridium sufflavum DSM 19573 TaxID=1121337 RepID=A0A318XHJ1_9FIRM|nr:phosphatidylglycerol lysyltransferase domain-containing protein [Ruminiclostridium sufflavum]PYG85889.1 hypothetical protein LY28_03043 [Ruminiclostridium sufflavum DSM 19573]
MQTTLKLSEISINDKGLFDEYFKRTDLQTSEMSFTNFYIWRDYYKIKFSLINDFLCIIASVEDNPFCFFPVGDYSNTEDLKNAIFAIRDYFYNRNKDFMICRVSEMQISVLEDLGIRFIAEEDRNNFDYIYSVQKLSTLSGKKLDGKRNHINKFKKLHTFKYEEISDENISSCIDILEKWSVQRNYKEEESLIAERKANLDLLDNYNFLRVKGALIKVDGKPEAFTVGEKLNSNTVVIHAEKANAEINGLYPLVNQQFLANHWKGIEYVNREQDLGIEGLRKAKLSYNPITILEKFTVRLC